MFIYRSLNPLSLFFQDLCVAVAVVTWSLLWYQGPVWKILIIKWIFFCRWLQEATL